MSPDDLVNWTAAIALAALALVLIIGGAVLAVISIIGMVRS